MTYHAGGELAMDALLYGAPSPKLQNYLHNGLEQAKVALGNIGQNFITHTKAMYERFNGDKTVNAMKATLYASNEVIDDVAIYSVPYDKLGEANYRMQHYIMANPTVAKMYNRSMCSGYEDSFVNTETGSTPTENILYRDVMDGVYDIEEDELVHYTHVSPFDDESDGMHIMDKLAVLDTWNEAELAISRGIDPTSPEMQEL